MNNSVPLRDCVQSLVSSWVETYREETNKKSSEAMLILSELLFRRTPPEISEAIHLLKTGSKSNPEAAFRLGKIYNKGKFVKKDLSRAHFYFKLAGLFRCQCGRQREAYHSSRISHVHECFSYESRQAIKALELTPPQRKKYESDFKSWRIRN